MPRGSKTNDVIASAKAAILKERERLAKEIACLDDALAALGGSTRPARRRPPKQARRRGPGRPRKRRGPGRPPKVHEANHRRLKIMAVYPRSVSIR